MRGRLPIIAAGYETTEMSLGLPRRPKQFSVAALPKVVQPNELTHFTADEAPPKMQWKDASVADGNP